MSKNNETYKWELEEAKEYIEKIYKSGFYGEVLLKFHDGQISFAEVKQKNKRPKDLIIIKA